SRAATEICSIVACVDGFRQASAGFATAAAQKGGGTPKSAPGGWSSRRQAGLRQPGAVVRRLLVQFLHGTAHLQRVAVEPPRVQRLRGEQVVDEPGELFFVNERN